MSERINKDPLRYIRRLDSGLLFFVLDGAHTSLNPPVIGALHNTGITFDDPVGRAVSTYKILNRPFETDSLVERARLSRRIRESHSHYERQYGAINNEDFFAVWSSLVFTALRTSEWLSRGTIKPEERSSIYEAFCQIGKSMKIEDLSDDVLEWNCRWQDVKRKFARIDLTNEFYKRAREELGESGFWLFANLQRRLLDPDVAEKLTDLISTKGSKFFDILFAFYPFMPSKQITRLALLFVKEPARGKLLRL